MNTLGRVFIISVTTLGLSFATQSFAQTFTYTQIDVPNSSGTTAIGINAYGQIVGISDDADGTEHGFLRDTDGTYLKLDYPGASLTYANGINDQGQIVGRWMDSKGYNHAFIRSPSGVFSSFDPPAPCSPSKDPAAAIAHRINNHGDIVGRCFSANHHEYGWILHYDGTFQILTGSGLNASDAWFVPIGSQYIAGGESGEGTHQSGLGIYWRVGTFHGALWDRNGGFTTLDVNNSQTSLRSMNSSGDITGIYYDTALARFHGFLLRNGVVTNIDFPNSSDSNNTVSNDSGVIAGGFTDVAGVEHGFIATCSGNGC
jgi:probable HAF family extracellular repeat protein